MAMVPPKKIWHKVPLGKDEMIWFFIIFFMVIMMAGITIGYIFAGNQNPPETFYRLSTEEFLTNAIENNIPANGVVQGVLEDGTTPALIRDTSGEIYMAAYTFNWSAVVDDGSGKHNLDINAIQLKKGETYQLHIGSLDMVHGFQLMGDNGLIMSIQIMPGYDYVIDFKPTTTGLFQIICNEYCGAGHHRMTGILEVVE